MKTFHFGGKMLCMILTAALATTCAPKPTEETNVSSPKVASTEMDSARSSAADGKMSVAVPEDAFVPLSEDEEKIVKDHWTDGNLFRPTLIVFSRERAISFLPYISNGEFDRQDGDWALSGDTLTIVIEGDTTCYKVRGMEGKWESLNLEMICGDKRVFEAARFNLYRDNEKESYRGEDFVGSWEAGDGFTFTDLENFTYYDPLCSEDFPGTWRISEDELYLKYTGGTCSNNHRGYPSQYTIVNLSDHWMILHDGDADITLAWYKR